MRKWIAFAVLSISTPVYAQNAGSTSGASSEIYFSYPSSTTSKTRLTTPPTVVAPGLAAAGIETCLGSASGGLSVMGGGLTFGGTKVDDGCTIRLLSRQLFAFGFQKAAVALMCQDDRVAAAMDAAGSPCPAAPVAPVETRERSRRSARAEDRNWGLFTPFVGAMEPSPLSAYAATTELTRTSALPLKPVTREELAWFDRTN
jgi:hypothetical protein